MAARLPLPLLEDLPKVILFHREDPRDSVITLQIPRGEGEDSSTYYIRTDNKPDMKWLKSLPHSSDLERILSYATHIAYFPHNDGHVRELKDLDQAPPMKRIRAQADRAMRIAAPRAGVLGHKGRYGRLSPLRRALSGRGRR